MSAKSFENNPQIIKLKKMWKEIKQKNIFFVKELTSDNEYSFNFKDKNWFVTIIYLISFIAMPIIYSLLKNYVFHVSLENDNVTEKWKILNIIFIYFIPIIGFLILIAFDWNTMIKKGAWVAYTHFIFSFLAINIVSSFFKKTEIEEINIFHEQIKFFLVSIIQLIGSIIVIFTNKTLRKQIITTLKEAKIDLLTWVCVFFVITSLLSLIFEKISDAANQELSTNSLLFLSKDSVKSSSVNQESLKKLLITPFGIFVTFLSSCFLAPINEELSYRYGCFKISSLKWIGFMASLIYFPSMHVQTFDDWNHIFGYFGTGIGLILLFIFSKGNTTYTIFLHMLWNTVVLVKMLA